MSYKKDFRRAYEGELIGDQLYHSLSERTADVELRKKFSAIAAVERATHAVLKPIAGRLGIVPRESYILETVARRCSEIERLSWSEFLGKAVREWPGYISRFKALYEMAPTDDLPALSYLIEHEVALVNFVTEEFRCAGSFEAMSFLEDYLGRVGEPVSGAR
jgi:hypothetical protein